MATVIFTQNMVFLIYEMYKKHLVCTLNLNLLKLLHSIYSEETFPISLFLYGIRFCF